MKKLRTLLVSIFGVFMLTGCSLMDLFPTKIKLESALIDKESVTLDIGTSATLIGSYAPVEYSLSSSPEWSIDNSTIATLSVNRSDSFKAKVTAKKSGTAIVTLRVEDKIATCSVKVNAAFLTSIEAKDYNVSFEVGETFEFGGTVTAKYNDNSTKDVTNKAIFTGYNMSTEGNQTVKVKYDEGGKSAETTYQITVYAAGDKPALEKTELLYDMSDVTANSYFDLDAAPVKGNAKLLVIPVWFTDSSNYISTDKKATVKSDIQKAYFGTNEETGWRSVKTFYEEESHGAVTITGTVSDWYEPNKASTNYYTSSGSDIASLVKNASDWYFEKNTSESRKDYDCDGNGHLDGVMLIYASPDCQCLGDSSADNMWAYCYWCQSYNANVNKPTANVFFWASYDFMYGTGHSVGNYKHGDTRYCNLDTHTYIHEMGHVFGLNDYYDYAEDGYKPAGGFSMQDYNVGSHDPYSVMALGWTNPYVPTETITLEIKPFQSSGDLILLSNNFSSKSPFAEYILLEFYTPTGLNEFDVSHQYNSRYPQGVNKNGIRIWHVDARLVSNSKGKITSNPNDGSILNLTSNTSDADSGHVYFEDYVEYNELFLCGKNINTYNRNSNFSQSDLWVAGDSFSMSAYSSQFCNGTKLNNGATLGWSIKVDSVSNTKAVITCTKA